MRSTVSPKTPSERGALSRIAIAFRGGFHGYFGKGQDLGQRVAGDEQVRVLSEYAIKYERIRRMDRRCPCVVLFYKCSEDVQHKKKGAVRMKTIWNVTYKMLLGAIAVLITAGSIFHVWRTGAESDQGN